MVVGTDMTMAAPSAVEMADTMVVRMAVEMAGERVETMAESKD